MPFYEYRPKSGECEKCDGCFVDLQKMSDASHTKCPDCGKACERVISAPIVSVRGDSYRAGKNAEKRAESRARAVGENATLREAAKKKTGQIEGHTHDCALVGCFLERSARRFGGLPHLVGADKSVSKIISRKRPGKSDSEK